MFYNRGMITKGPKKGDHPTLGWGEWISTIGVVGLIVSLAIYSFLVAS